MSEGYVYDHAWTQERIRLAGLEAALDPVTHERLAGLGVGPGWRCLEVGAGGGAVAFWLAKRVAPDGLVVATDLETDFLEVASHELRGPLAILKGYVSMLTDGSLALDGPASGKVFGVITAKLLEISDLVEQMESGAEPGESV